MRPRPAPMAVRMANSRRLPMARASSRLATLAHAMGEQNVFFDLEKSTKLLKSSM